ncbi:MAG: hypothetical protein NC230_09780, partial [Bacteroides sp.]|nr:hypothetical protein [Bacteroides sp.]
ATTATAAGTGNRANRYTDADVEAAWDAYAAARPTEHILVNTIRACRPVNKGNDTYDVALDNEIQVEEFSGLRPQLLAHIRNAIANDSFNLTFSINTSGPKPTIWNDHEILAHLVSKSQSIVKLIDRFNLKLI